MRATPSKDSGTLDKTLSTFRLLFALATHYSSHQIIIGPFKNILILVLFFAFGLRRNNSCTKGAHIILLVLKRHLERLILHLVVFQDLLRLFQPLFQFHRWILHGYTKFFTGRGLRRVGQMLTQSSTEGSLEATGVWGTSISDVRSFAPSVERSSDIGFLLALSKLLWPHPSRSLPLPHLPRTLGGPWPT